GPEGPFPVKEGSEGETSVRVGPAARTIGAETPRRRTTSAPTITNTAVRMLNIVRSEPLIAQSPTSLSRDEPSSILNLGVVRCGALYGGLTRRASLVLISTSVQEALTRRRTSTEVEEQNVERCVCGSRGRPRDLSRDRCRPAFDGHGLAGASGVGR